MTYGLRGAAPDLVCGDRSHICRSRGEVLRRFGCGWFRGLSRRTSIVGVSTALQTGPRCPPRNQGSW